MSTTPLDKVRELMRTLNVDAVIVPGTDPHQSEYPAAHWRLREWLTGFTGSNGTAVVTAHEAALWTDSRYFLQADEQLAGTGFELMREGIAGEPTREEWLAQRLDDDAVIAIDGRLFPVLDVSRFERFCGENGYMLVTDFDLAERVWADRPARPSAAAVVHSEDYAGESATEKIGRVLDAVERQGADALLVTALDEVAWLLNLRSSERAYTPVVIASAYIKRHECTLFIDSDLVTDEVARHLKACDVRVRDYDDLQRFLERRRDSEVVLIDPNRVSDTLANALPCQKVYAHSPIAVLKAVKNEVQIEGFAAAHRRDGAALVRLLMWLEQAVPAGGVTELDVWERGKLERGRSELYRGDSFAMIAAYGPHGAIVHYEPTPESAAMLRPEGLLLIDSGAQYLDGTTDVTRTIALGEPTGQMCRDYTLVLKGHLALARAQFPEGTCGVQLDALARMPLWQQGLGYGHGTGHGVGHYLGCHEGPHSIRTDLNPNAIKAGMVTSDEPGLYRTGEYGIRIENLLLTVNGDHTEWGDFLRFESLTLVPYDLRLIERSMLTADEVEQINAYHERVVVELTPLLDDDERQWLVNHTTW